MKFSWRQRLNMSRWAIKHPWLTISFWLGIAFAGIFAFSSLQYALFPDVTFPVVIVRASANDLDNALETTEKLTTPLEQSLLELESLEMVSSSSFPNETVITNLFFAGDTLEDATEIIKNQIAQVQLPENTQLKIIPYNLNESSAITYALTSKTQSLEEIAIVAQKTIIPELAKIEGILKVNLLGLEEAETPSIIRFNGEEALAIQVVKKGDGNTLEVVKAVTQTIAQLQPQLSETQIDIAQTEADYIQEATQATIDSLWLAIILAIMVIFPFLRSFKATFITALSIPLSLLATFIVMAIANFNLETITLLALALVIGIVVDDAIVDVENIARHIEAGESPREAAIKGSDEIGLTVSASTLTIVAVFLPVAFTSGNVGQFFKPFALTISTAVMTSLFIARTLAPVLSMYWLRKKEVKTTNHQPNQFTQQVLNVYTKLLTWSLCHRKTIVVASIASLIFGLSLIPLIPQGFIPQLDRGEFNIIYTTELPRVADNANLSLSQTNSDSSAPEQNTGVFSWIDEVKSNPTGFILRRTRRAGDKIETVIVDLPEIESAFNTVGFRGQPNRGKIYVKLKDDRNLTTTEVQNLVREKLPTLKGVNISVEDIKFVDTGDEKPFSLALVSNNLTSLYQTSAKVNQKLSQLSALQDLTYSPNNIDATNLDNLPLIEHLRGKPAVTFTANLAQGEALGDLTEQIIALVTPLLNSDVSLSIGGDSARMVEVLKQFGITFIFSLAMMLLLLWALFGRLLEPLVVALSLPLSIVGAMIALLVSQNDFGMISLLGLIFLIGLLDKNALLLVDYTNQLRQQGQRRHDAIILSCQTRLRPILMTSLSTILGMLPLAIGLGAGAQLRQPMAVAIIGGLLTSSLLSLIVVPVLYTLVEDIWKKQ